MTFERHQQIAVAIFAAVSLWVLWRDGWGDQTLGRILLMLVTLIPIMLYRLIAWLSSFGWPEWLAWDFGSENHPAPYAFFFWMLFLITCAYQIFQWSFW